MQQGGKGTAEKCQSCSKSWGGNVGGQGRKAQDSRKIIRKTCSTNLDLSLRSLPSLPAPGSSSQGGKAALLHRTQNDLAMHPGTFAPTDYFPSTLITLTSHYYTQHTQTRVLHSITPYLKETINIWFLCIRFKNNELLLLI